MLVLFAGENEAAQPESEFAAQLTQPDSAESQHTEQDSSAAHTQQLAAYDSTMSQLNESSEDAAEPAGDESTASAESVGDAAAAADEEAESAEDDYADEFEADEATQQESADSASVESRSECERCLQALETETLQALHHRVLHVTD